ncbi:MAG: hypothetical protein ACRYGR_09900 [Janthinobacterium lividum]
MSLFSEIKTYLFGASASVVADLAVAEKSVVVSLQAFSGLVTAGAVVTDDVAKELEALLPTVSTAIANADAKVQGAAVKVKSVIAEAEAWLAARTITATAGASTGEKMTASMFHIS